MEKLISTNLKPNRVMLLVLLMVMSMMVFNEGKENRITKCIEKERQALLGFKQSLEDNGNILSSWRSNDEDCCAWKRIRCDNRSNHVIMLDLSSKKSSFIASHEINSALIELDHLEYLDLSYNKFSSTIPKFIGSLKRLQHLNLCGNPLFGTIPSQIQNLTKLKILDIGNTQLEGPFPDNLSQFLIILRLNNNNLTGPLPNFSHMSSLRVLDVSSNSFTGVFSEIHLENLTNLKQLALSFNPLLELNFNTNWVPKFQLNSIELSSCNLGPKFPSWLKTQLNLSIIDLSNSRISDTIPPWFPNLTSNLNNLNLSLNQITGSLPNFSVSHNDFPIVDLSSNKLYGAIPPSLSKSYMLDLSSNNLTSFELFLCSKMIGESQMEILDLSNNFLSENLLDCLCKFKNLHVLNLESNKLFGTIPSSIGCLHKILTLSLRHNNFSGVLPTSLKNLTNLKFLDFGENNLEGKVPRWVGERLTKLMVLDLNANRFNGSIPSNLCNLYYMQILDLSQNTIHGNIPPCMDNFTSMVHSSNMDGDDKTRPEGFLGRNSHNLELYNLVIVWKGVKHVCGKSIVFMRLIDLSSNKLEGEIPQSLTNLVELVQLNLSKNHLSGSLPMKIGKLQKLESLDLSHNQFSGEVPQSLANMSFLGYLDLSNNHLSGKIPSSTQLQSFDSSSYVGNTELCGQPLEITCLQNETLSYSSDDECNEEWLDMSWFYMGVFVGFIIGFCGVCWILLQSTSFSSCRIACSQFLNSVGEWFYMRIIVKVSILMPKFSIC